MTKTEASLLARISQRDDIKIAVVGTGYVGLPLAIRLAREGFRVLGVDIDKRVIDEVKAGRSTIEGISDDEVNEVVNGSQRLTPLLIDANPNANTEKSLEPLIGVDIFVICVQTPLHRHRGWEPETQFISKSAQLICRVGEEELKRSSLPAERLIILESTTYPGTTRSLFAPVREKFAELGTRCLLAYSPERTSPGPEAHGAPDKSTKQATTFEIPRIVGGIDQVSCETASALYRTVFSDVHPVASLEAAELTKLVENTFRFISIGFANEMARVARSFGLNVWDIIEAAKTKPFGLDLCFPGLVGGHCLPIDPHYLGWAYRNRRNVATFVDVAERSHQDARRDAFDLVLRLLSQQARGLPDASILFFGVAYKKNVGDTRESGVIDLMKKLYGYGARLTFWDPVRARQLVKRNLHVTFSEAERQLLSKTALEKLTKGDSGESFFEPRELEGDWQDVRKEVLYNGFDCIVLATDHTEFQPAYLELLTETNAPPMADINNAIKSWLRTAQLAPEQENEVKRHLLDRSRFMLFGFD